MDAEIKTRIQQEIADMRVIDYLEVLKILLKIKGILNFFKSTNARTAGLWHLPVKQEITHSNLDCCAILPIVNPCTIMEKTTTM